MTKNVLDVIALVLVIVGALNWGLIGIGGWSLVNLLLGSIPVLERIVYILVGVAGLWTIYFALKE